jgi:hypothetical protein
MKSKLKIKGKRGCPKGVICFENITFYIIIVCVVISGYYLYKTLKTEIYNNTQQIHSVNKVDLVKNFLAPENLSPNYYTDSVNRKDVLLNPYSPPLKDNNYNMQYNNFRNSTNMKTNRNAQGNTQFRQIGLLAPQNEKTNGGPVPLMGKPLYSNRNKWQYYSMSDQFNSVKLPISVKGKSAMTEYGCDELYNGDTVYVDGINEVFVATIYDNDNLPYYP